MPMMWRAGRNAVLFVLILIPAIMAVATLTVRAAHAESATQENDAIEKTVAYLKNKNVRMDETKLKRVVHRVYKESRLCKLDYRLALAVIDAESNFHPDAVSNKGARGLMQIMPSLAKTIAEGAGVKYKDSKCLHQPEKNIKLGIYHLTRLVEDYKDLPTALHAYNAGEHWVRTRTSKKAPKTAYTKQVMEEYRKSLSVLPDADEPDGKTYPFVDTFRESGWRSAASAGDRLLPKEDHFKEERGATEGRIGRWSAQTGRSVSEILGADPGQKLLRNQPSESERVVHDVGLRDFVTPESPPDEMPSTVSQEPVVFARAHLSWVLVGMSQHLTFREVAAAGTSPMTGVSLEDGLQTSRVHTLRM
jgi:soluble lytic murein transglycosylase